MIVFSNLSLKRGQTELLENASATINPKQKVGLVGKNGCGKSSLFSLLKKELTPEGGEVNYPANWRVSWVNQETPALDIPAIDYVIQGDREYCRLQQELNEANERNDGHAIARIHGQLETLDAWTIQSRAASLLHGLGFSQEETTQPVKAFSGGWRMRLNLAQALLCPSDLLLLDEPTNHMDIVGKETLESMLKDFSGTLIFVSHDRYFVRKVANRLLVFEDGTTHLYQFGYEEYQEKLDREAAESGDDYRKNPAALGGAISQNGAGQQSKGTQETGGKKAYYNPGKERSKIEKKVKKAEEELAVKEEKLDALKQELLRPEYQSSYSKLTEIQGEIDALEEEIMADMENWEELSQQLEELES